MDTLIKALVRISCYVLCYAATAIKLYVLAYLLRQLVIIINYKVLQDMFKNVVSVKKKKKKNTSEAFAER